MLSIILSPITLEIMVRLYKPDTNVSEGENLKICAEVMNKSDCPIQFNAAVAFVSPPGMGTASMYVFSGTLRLS